MREKKEKGLKWKKENWGGIYKEWKERVRAVSREGSTLLPVHYLGTRRKRPLVPGVGHQGHRTQEIDGCNDSTPTFITLSLTLALSTLTYHHLCHTCICCQLTSFSCSYLVTLISYYSWRSPLRGRPTLTLTWQYTNTVEVNQEDMVVRMIKIQLIWAKFQGYVHWN